MASPRRQPRPPAQPPPAATAATAATAGGCHADAAAAAKPPAQPPAPVTGENVTITIKTKSETKVAQAPNAVTGENVAIAIKTGSKPEEKQRSVDKDDGQDLCFVRNSSFLSRDIEARARDGKEKGKESPKTESPKKLVKEPSQKNVSPPKSPPKKESPPQTRPPKDVVSPPVSTFKLNRTDSRGEESTVAMIASKLEAAAPPKKEVKEVTSPPVAKLSKSDSKVGDNSVPPKVPKRENSIKETASKIEKLSLGTDNNEGKNISTANGSANSNAKLDDSKKNEESNGVGDKIKKFEKAAEDASGTAGRLSRPGSVRGRSRTERLGSDEKEEFPPPATPFKDNVHFDLSTEKTEPFNSNVVERQQSITKNNTPNTVKWQRSDSHQDKMQKPEPQKIIKPEFKPMPSPVDVTIRSPSLGAKILDQFPSHGTAFRNVASPDQARNVHKFNEDVNTQNNIKPCKIKKDKYSASVSKGSSYFTRGSEEIWLVKKKDIEEIEERVLDSFRRAGGNMCMRSESTRPASDSGQGVSFSHATMGRNKRQMYARSESLDPQWAGNRAQTLKRQTSVACTCGHDKKPRARSAGADALATEANSGQRPRARSQADDAQHVLDKYETLV